MSDFVPRVERRKPTVKLWHEHSDGIHREPEFYRARGLGVPHRQPDNPDKVKAQLLGETEL